nr:hypothetical protein B0A51_14287 [Rachicladosporium sp. CCFEE 5018]
MSLPAKHERDGGEGIIPARAPPLALSGKLVKNGRAAQRVERQREDDLIAAETGLLRAEIDKSSSKISARWLECQREDDLTDAEIELPRGEASAARMALEAETFAARKILEVEALAAQSESKLLCAVYEHKTGARTSDWTDDGVFIVAKICTAPFHILTSLLPRFIFQSAKEYKFQALEASGRGVTTTSLDYYVKKYSDRHQFPDFPVVKMTKAKNTTLSIEPQHHTESASSLSSCDEKQTSEMINCAVTPVLSADLIQLYRRSRRRTDKSPEK